MIQNEWVSRQSPVTQQRYKTDNTYYDNTGNNMFTDEFRTER